MPAIDAIIAALVEQLKYQKSTPRIREVALDANLPPSAFPQARVELHDELFEPNSADVTALVTLYIVCAAGRRNDATAEARSLAHQVRRSLYSSSALGGLVKSVGVRRISYGAAAVAAESAAVTATAEIDLVFRYCEAEV
jgi:hypothetical protein